MTGRACIPIARQKSKLSKSEHTTKTSVGVRTVVVVRQAWRGVGEVAGRYRLRVHCTGILHCVRVRAGRAINAEWNQWRVVSISDVKDDRRFTPSIERIHRRARRADYNEWIVFTDVAPASRRLSVGHVTDKAQKAPLTRLL